MEIMKAFRLLAFILLTLLTVSPSYSAILTDVDPYREKVRGAENGERPEEALVVVNLPIELVKRELSAILLHKDSPITKIDRLDFDPINRLIMLEGDIVVPADIMLDLTDLAGGDVEAKHKFKTVISLPSSKMLANTSWFQIKIEEFKLDGLDWKPSLHVLGQFSSVLIANTSFCNYMLDVKPEMEVNQNDPVIMVRDLIQKKGVRFRGETISFKLDLKSFADFSRFAEITDLRIWQFSPVLLRGSNQMFFRMEAGLGKPGQAWVEDISARSEHDERTLQEVREQFYVELGNAKKLTEEVEKYLDDSREQMNLQKLNPRYEQEVSDLRAYLGSKIRTALDKKNPEFLSDPEYVHESIKNEAKEYVITGLSDIKRRKILEEGMARGGRNSNDRPFLQKRISQKTLSQAVRFFRDFEFEGDNMFPVLDVYLNPALPGLVMKGIMNLDMNWVLAMGLEGAPVDFGDMPIHFADDLYGAGIPFETAIRISVEDGGWLGLDVKSVSLFKGSQKMVFSNYQDHGQFIINFVKMAIVNTLATTLIEQPVPPTADAGDEGETTDTYLVLRENINRQNSAYASLFSGRDLGLEALINVAKVDIENNPFLKTGQAFVEGKTELFFKELVKYDEASGLIKFKMDPKVVSESILSSPNDVQVWNVEALFDKKMDETYLDLALGNKTRSKTYVQEVFYRQERRDSENFVGTRDEGGIVDLGIKMDLGSFENLINTILSDAYTQQSKLVEAELGRDKESEHYMIRDVHIKAAENGLLELNATMTHISKTERGALNPARWFGERWPVKRKTIGVKTQIGISVDRLAKYQKGLKLSQNEVFFGDELLKVDLYNAKFTMSGDTGIVDKMLLLAVGNLDFKNSTLAKKVKVLVLRALRGFLNSEDPNKNGNTELGGVKINRYAKLLTHDEEILIQLNPHILGTAFDVKLLANQNFRGRDVGFVVSKAQNILEVNFQTVGNMAAVDKGELYQIMAKAKKIMDPYYMESNKEEFLKKLKDLTLFDQFLYNSDYKKMSLFHRFIHVLSQYDGVISNTHNDFTVAQNIANAIGRDLEMPQEKLGSREITASGVELMYFLSSAMVLKGHLDLLINKIKEFGVEDEVPYFADFQKRAIEFEKRFIAPLLQQYEAGYSEHNEKIIQKGLTDWNHTYYPDARFSDAVYKLASQLFKRR
jgi:hypothetical protein